MIHEPRKVAMTILTKLEPQGVENSQDLMVDKPDDHISALKTIAENVISAVNNRDASNLAQCLSQFFAALENAEEVEQQDSEPVAHY